MQNYLKNTNYQSKQPNPTNTDKRERGKKASKWITQLKHPHTPKHSKKNDKTSKFNLLVESRHFLKKHSRLFPTKSRIGFICCPPSRHTIQSGFRTCANNRKRKFLFPLHHCSVFFSCFFFRSSSLPIKAEKNSVRPKNEALAVHHEKQ